MAIATIDVQIPKGTWVNLYTAASLPVGTKISVFNKGSISCVIASGDTTPASNSGIPLFAGFEADRRDVMSDVGLWAYAETGSTIVCITTASLSTQTTSGSGGGGDASAANQVTGNTTLSTISGKMPALVSGNVPTTISTPLPAGSNALGTVSVTALPAIPAGSNNIGSVNFGNAIPAGSNAIGTVIVTSLPALPTGSNTIGTVAVNSLPALPTGANTIGSVNLASALPAGTNTIGGFNLRVSSNNPGSTLMKLETTASTNATSLKASAGNVVGWQFTNRSASERTVKLYNKASAPTVGTDATLMKWVLPAGSIMNNPVTPGIYCSTGIAVAVTTGYLDTDTTGTAAGDVVGHILYA